MSDTPKWYVTDYPVEGSFAVTDGYDILAMISGGKTVGDECELASRIAKLPDLERELADARANLKITQEAWVKAKVDRVELLRERNEAIELLKIASWYSTTTTQEVTEKFLRKIGKWEGAK
jgi:hypothetical protein